MIFNGRTPDVRTLSLRTATLAWSMLPVAAALLVRGTQIPPDVMERRTAWLNF
jgi:hypothetical protein